MSIEIKIPKEINEYKPKSFFGLTSRQFICSVLAVCINVPLYFFGRKYLGDEIMSWIILFIAFPLGLIAFFKYNGMNFESFILQYIKTNILTSPKRVYSTENTYEEFLGVTAINESIPEVKKSKK